MTRHEKIKEMSIEQFAGFIARFATCDRCPVYPDCEGWCELAFEGWLKQEINKTIAPDCPYVVDGKCIGKNACDLQDKCVFYKDGGQE